MGSPGETSRRSGGKFRFPGGKPSFFEGYVRSFFGHGLAFFPVARLTRETPLALYLIYNCELQKTNFGMKFEERHVRAHFFHQILFFLGVFVLFVLERQ